MLNLPAWAKNICLLAMKVNVPAVNQSIEMHYKKFGNLEEEYLRNMIEIPPEQTIAALKECVFVLSEDLPSLVWTGFPSVQEQETATQTFDKEIKQLEGAVFYRTTPIIILNHKPDCSFAIKHRNKILVMQAWPEV